MARLPRLTVPGYPHHVIQRGNNRQAVFLTENDRQRFLEYLGEYARQFGVAVHAYVLMDNHFHLLVTPGTSGGLAAMVQAMGRRYVQTFNRLHGRTGSLWEGRYRSTLIQTERYLLACMVYIDLNPVRAGMVERPEDFPWSSHRHYIGERADTLVTPHALYWGLGNTPFAREAAYRELVQAGLARDTLNQLTDSAIKGWALGDDAFVREVGKQTTRRPRRAHPGRPPAAPATP